MFVRLAGWMALVARSASKDAELLDIRVHGAAPLITAEAILAPGARCSALAECRARLIDSDARRVLAVSPLRPDGRRVRAELSFYAPATAGALWVGVADEGKRPAWGTRLRRMRRALRWADAALRAASRPGLAFGLLGRRSCQAGTAHKPWRWTQVLPANPAAPSSAGASEATRRPAPGQRLSGRDQNRRRGPWPAGQGGRRT
jgi:hypothetical protein